jgi:hypothetical protein
LLSADAILPTHLQAIAACDNVICKCEKVTEAEVVAACHRALPIDSTQAIRKRTRAGMGSCQGKGVSEASAIFCIVNPRLSIAQELLVTATTASVALPL